MSKTHVNLRIDGFVWDTAKKMGVNGSKLFEDTLRSFVVQKNPDNIDIIKLNEDIEEERESIHNSQMKLNELLAQKAGFEQRRKQEDDAELKESMNMADTIKRSGVLWNK